MDERLDSRTEPPTGLEHGRELGATDGRQAVLTNE
jgi:hypothetical protein